MICSSSCSFHSLEMWSTISNDSLAVALYNAQRVASIPKHPLDSFTIFNCFHISCAIVAPLMCIISASPIANLIWVWAFASPVFHSFCNLMSASVGGVFATGGVESSSMNFSIPRSLRMACIQRFHGIGMDSIVLNAWFLGNIALLHQANLLPTNHFVVDLLINTQLCIPRVTKKRLQINFPFENLHRNKCLCHSFRYMLIYTGINGWQSHELIRNIQCWRSEKKAKIVIWFENRADNLLVQDKVVSFIPNNTDMVTVE